jgi:protein CWC15
MTTAHKPTFHPAVATCHQGGYKFFATGQQISARNLPGQLELKYRQPGQNDESDLRFKDFKADLEMREAEHKEKVDTELRRKGILPQASEKTLAITAGERTDHKAIEDALDAFDDADDSSSGEESSSSSDSEDEEALLQKELAKIKREREVERRAKMIAEARANKKRQREDVIKANVLLAQKMDSSYSLKRHWTEDTVFKNQATAQTKKKRFVNDPIRNDFHKRFMNKYIL